MSREKECFRENIEMLNARFPDKDMLTKKDVAVVLGVTLRSRQLGRIRFNSATRTVSKADLARQISI